METFSASARFARDARATTLAAAAKRRPVGVGASLGGLALLHAHRVEPARFAGLFLQSGSYFRRRTDPQEARFGRFARVDRFVGTVLRGAGGAPVPTTITVGLDEENYGNNAAVARRARRAGLSGELHAARGGHDWPTWRRALESHLAAASPKGVEVKTHLHRPRARRRGRLAARVRGADRPARRVRVARRAARARRQPRDVRAVRSALPGRATRSSSTASAGGTCYPREWLKKVALMDDVYLLNNPFTFQAMEKHSAYCAMMRLGLKVPRDVADPAQAAAAERAVPDDGRALQPPFDLADIGGAWATRST